MTIAAEYSQSPDAGFPLLDVNDETVESALENLLGYAVRLGAGDLFLCTNDQHVRVEARHLGMMRSIAVLSAEVGRRMITLIKTRGLLDIAERRRPQEGRWIYMHEDDASNMFDLRISTIPTAFGEDMAIRLLERSNKRHQLDRLGMTREQNTALQATLDSPGGLILFTGPTGSGKTATLYSCLQLLNDGRRKINTIEDPIEYALEGIRQSQINPAIDLGFSDLLRSVMRQSPDVIMVGEVRDPETASIAIRAANSGHLVLATIHATAAVGAIQSMRGLGVHSHFLATALRCIVAQRLVRTLCPHCKTAFDLDDAPHTFDDVRAWLEPGEGAALWSAKGCRKCHMTGYTSRIGVFEVMPVSRTIRNLVSENVPTREIRMRSVEERMLEFRHAALIKVAQGATSMEEVFRAIPTEHLSGEE